MSRYEGMIAETVSFKGFNDDDVEGYLARPLGPGPFPGVIFIHHAPGWDEDSKMFTCQLARAGFVTISPNLYCREAPDAEPDDAAAVVRSRGGIPDTQSVGDFAGAASYLRSSPYTNGKVGIVGWCSGGRQSVLAGCKLDLDAVVDCWGGRIVATPEDLTPAQPVAVIDLIDGLSAPLLGLFGNDDQNPSPEHVETLRAALQAHGKTFEFHSYDGAGHGFMAPSRPAYRVEPTVDARLKIINFFREHLSG